MIVNCNCYFWCRFEKASERERGERLKKCTFVRTVMGSLQTRHFLTRGAQTEQQLTWPHGPKRISRFKSEQTMHSSTKSNSDISDKAEAPISGESVKESPSPWAPQSPRLKSSVWNQRINQQTDHCIALNCIELHWIALKEYVNVWDHADDLRWFLAVAFGQGSTEIGIGTKIEWCQTFLVLDRQVGSVGC